MNSGTSVPHKSDSDFSADAEAWVQWAEQTYRGSHVLFNFGDPFLWFAAAFLGHQALEMFLKAALIRRGRRVAKGDIWGHNLLPFVRDLESAGIEFPMGITEDLDRFNAFFDELRYPHPAKKVLELGTMEGELLDSLVLVLRPLSK